MAELPSVFSFLNDNGTYGEAYLAEIAVSYLSAVGLMSDVQDVKVKSNAVPFWIVSF